MAVPWILCGVGLSAVTAMEIKARWLQPPTPPEIVRDVTVRRASDEQGRRASFRILLFSDEFRWQLSSYDAIEDGASSPHFSEEMKKVLDSAQEIICVGASSEEVPGGRELQEGPCPGRMASRAPRRSDCHVGAPGAVAPRARAQAEHRPPCADQGRQATPRISAAS